MKEQASFCAIGIGLLLVGAALRFWVSNRRFNRRSITGLQRFHSYPQSVITRFIEGVARVIGTLLALAGFALLLAGVI